MRVRSDIVFVLRPDRNESYWIAKDPVALNYHFYPEDAYFIIENLTANSNIEELRQGYESRFGKELSDARLSEYLTVLIRDQIVLTDQFDDGARIAKLSEQQAQNRWKGMFANPLAIKLPSWNFDTLLSGLRPIVTFLFRPWFFWGVLFLFLFAFAILITNWDEFRWRLPSARHFFQSQNIVLILLCLAVTKVIHELAHALTCRAFGAECHEIGMMFLFFTPCMYCDVSDAWMIREKWKRITIASAGIFVELTIASLATLIWYFSEPGFLNTISLNLMFICSVSTLFFNGNPLLRYDGYFILSDLWGIPNLWVRSRNYLVYLANRILFGLEIESPESSKRLTLITYGICSICYRLLLLFVILFFLMNWLSYLQLEILGVVMVGLVIISQVVKPILSVIRKVGGLILLGKMRLTRFSLLLTMLAATLVLFFAIPFPHTVSVPAYLEFADAKRVYVRTPGVLRSFASYQESVRNGDLLFELENPELQIAHLEIQGELAKNKMLLARLHAMRIWNPDAGDRIPAQQELVTSLTITELSLAEQLRDLELYSNDSGILIAPRSSKAMSVNIDEGNQLPFWSDIPLMEKNIGAYFDRGDLMALIGKPGRFSAIALVRQEYIDLLEPGQTARLQVSGTPHRTLSGELVSLALMREDELPADVMDFLGARYTDEIQKSEIESGQIYLAKFELEKGKAGLQFESARVRIQVESSTLAFRFGRYIKRTFSSLFD